MLANDLLGEAREGIHSPSLQPHNLLKLHHLPYTNPVNWYLISGEGDCGEDDCGEDDCGEGE